MSLNSLPPKKCYIKRRKYDEQPLPASSNIFETGSPKEIGSSKEISFETKPEVTIQTEAETSFNEESFQKKKLELSQAHRIHTLPASHLFDKQNQDWSIISRNNESMRMQTVGVPSLHMPSPQRVKFKTETPQKYSSPNKCIARKKFSECTIHISDPLYLRNKQNFAIRVQKNFLEVKSYWQKRFIKQRQDKSLVQSSLQRADRLIKDTNLDVVSRQRSPSFEETLRQNIKQKLFVMHSRIKGQIHGLRGRGGITGSFLGRKHMVEQVYKHDAQRLKPIV